jgi:hypothetical protein
VTPKILGWRDPFVSNRVSNAGEQPANSRRADQEPVAQGERAASHVAVHASSLVFTDVHVMMDFALAEELTPCPARMGSESKSATAHSFIVFDAKREQGIDPWRALERSRTRAEVNVSRGDWDPKNDSAVFGCKSNQGDSEVLFRTRSKGLHHHQWPEIPRSTPLVGDSRHHAVADWRRRVPAKRRLQPSVTIA